MKIRKSFRTKKILRLESSQSLWHMNTFWLCFFSWMLEISGSEKHRAKAQTKIEYNMAIRGQLGTIFVSDIIEAFNAECSNCQNSDNDPGELGEYEYSTTELTKLPVKVERLAYKKWNAQ
ncbi:hypothetical protein BpHYR1_002434 [Brachionus plicatilis]|uniref:Uncharacterized protein n=1 Tax=Brachionus plicatilis TaxID=10195 RepID=A0A3M7QXN7_BRAPC|nr:hypothetical protein BpHYR1_002434 [Brachionus plicatilis]